MSSFIVIRNIDENFVSSTTRMRIANSVVEFESNDFDDTVDFFLRLNCECELHWANRKKFDDSIMLAKKTGNKIFSIEIPDTENIEAESFIKILKEKIK